MQQPKRNIIPILLIGAIAYVVYRKVQLANNAYVKNVKVKLDLSTPYVPKLLAIFTIDNPTPTSANLKSVYGKVLYKSTPIADVFYDTPTTIIANGETKLNIEIFPTWSNISSTIKNMIASKNLSGLFFDGQFVVDGIAFPVKQSLLSV